MIKNKPGGLKQKMQAKPAICHADRPAYARQLCHPCYNKWLRINNPGFAERQRENCRKWCRNNADKKRASDKNWLAKQDKSHTNDRHFHQYGMTVDDYNYLLAKQNGVCAICKRVPKKGRLHVDHDHNTGIIRGLLCFRCNFGMSFFSDDPEAFKAAWIYLSEVADRGAEFMKRLEDKEVKSAQEETAKLDELMDLYRFANTKEIPLAVKAEIKSRYDSGVSVSKLLTIFPQCSRSAIWRAVKGEVTTGFKKRSNPSGISIKPCLIPSIAT